SLGGRSPLLSLARFPMTDTSSLDRKSVTLEIAARTARSSPNGSVQGLPSPISEYFGVNTFGARQMRDKLPRDVYTKLLDAVRMGKKLDLEIAPRVAHAIKEEI